MRLLLIEDEDSIRSALACAFERDGHEVRAVSTLADGRALLADWSPELAISDLKLPDGSGLELAASLGIPFVMLSGYATYDDAVLAMRSGAVDFFTKPVAIKDIRAAIARIGGQGFSTTTCVWIDRSSAQVVAKRIMLRIRGRIARCAASELLQACPAGRLEVHEDQLGCRLWLDAAVDWTGQDDRRRWLDALGVDICDSSFGVLLKCPAELHTVADAESEAFWPQALASQIPIQAQAWIGVGSWLLASLRKHNGQIAGLAPGLGHLCATCGVNVTLVPESLIRTGIGSAEREGLLTEDDLGAPVA